MNNEIKEILDRLERIDHKEYSCGFEFADSGSFDETCECFEERKKMADYITNLQTKNEYLETWNSEIKLQLDNLQQELEKTRLENKVLKEQMVAMVQPTYTYGIRGDSSE